MAGAYQYTPPQPKMRNEEHLKMVDHLRASFQPVEHRDEYLQSQADARRAEYDAEQERQKRMKAQRGE